jgi:hypothetical protein
MVGVRRATRARAQGKEGHRSGDVGRRGSANSMDAGGMTYQWVTSQWISIGEECFRRQQLSRDGSQLLTNGRSSLKGQSLS